MQLNLIQVVMFSCGLMVAFHHAAEAQNDGTISNSQKSVFLRINQYYVLYTKPIVPYLDKHGNLMVGLEGVKDFFEYSHPKPNDPNAFMSASLIENARAGTAFFSSAGHTFRFTANSTNALVDNKAVVMPAATVMAGGHMVVPISVLSHHLGLPISWDPKTRTVLLRSDGLSTNVDGFLMERVEVFHPDLWYKGIIPWSLRLHKTSPVKQQLTFTIKNVSGHSFESGAVDVQTMIAADTEVLCDAPPASVDVHRPLPLPIAAGATVSKSMNLNWLNSNGAHYVAALIVKY